MDTQVFGQYSLVSIVLRSFVLLAITVGIAIACRRRSAAVQHQIVVLGFCGCLLFPIVTLVLPNLTLPLLPSREPPDAVAVAIAVPRETVARAEAANLRTSSTQTMPVIVAIAPAQEPLPPRREQAAQLPQVAESSAILWPSLATWLVVTWGVGASICVARLMSQVLMVRRGVRHCNKVESESWQTLRDDVTRQLSLRISVPLKSHRGAMSPMVVGYWRPVVLLPSDADKWTTERRRQVLLHELAHVLRRDVLTQSVAGLVCSLYWFNPLAWWGAAQMKRLREIACDDVVVAHTSKPSIYAQTLLDVAKAYRCRQQICTVAMARTAQVEGRIRAILDATRQRASLSKRSARMVGSAAIVVSIVVGSLQLTSRAEVPKKPPAETNATTKDAAKDKPAKHDADETRTITVRVLDEAGQTVSGANVQASVSNIEPTNKRYPTRQYTTNDVGEAAVTIPSRLRILRLWASKADHVPLFVNFAEGTHEDGHLIPEAFEFRLQPGARLSAVVVDEEGKPVKDARVEVMVDVNDRYSGVNPKPSISTWLSSEDDAVRTDKDGHWEITNAPAPRKDADYKFRMMVTHPDFAGDTNWGGLQVKQGITVEQLRGGTAKLVLDRGIAISGTIIGPDGKPVTKGLVVWNDDPYLAQGTNETRIDASGRYETLRLAPGQYPITVLAPGFAPEQRKIQVSESLKDVDFQLTAGTPIKIKIVDEAGKPIPGVGVQISGWRGTKAIFNHKHPNVPDSAIPRQADQDGVYTWTWAPADAVNYHIGAIGHDDKELSLVAKEGSHEVMLPATPAIFGKVVDAESGKPIDKFRVVPVKAYRPDFYSTDFQDSSIAEGKQGAYRIEIDSYGQSGNRYRVRIEAKGYRTALGQESLAVGDPALEEDFRLEKAPALRGVVIDTAGAPVNEFTVAVGTPTTSPHFSVDRPDASFGISFHVEGKNEFELPATFEPQRIRVFSNSGFAEVLRQPNEAIGTMTIEPWASVSGRLVQDGKPVVGVGVYFSPLAKRGLTEARFQDGLSATTDANGNFRFDRLPPMSGSVRPALGPWQDSVLTSGESVPLGLKPGDRREIVLGGDGATIAGRVVATGNDAEKLSKRWSINYLVSRSRGVDYPRDAAALSLDPAGPLDAAWLRQPDFQTWVATRENYFVKLADDGRLKIHGVRPGLFDLVIQLYEQPVGCLVETIGERVIPITIDGGQSEVEIGDVEVACRRGPRVGSDMRAFEFTDSEGRRQSINDLNGRHVLFHVWASWCQPCLASMPEVKLTAEQHSQDRLMVVGLNIDKDLDTAKVLVGEGGWNWAQNYLGDNSDMMRQLGVSSVPAYYLIGPDGKLVGSANAWEQVEKMLSAGVK